MPGQVKYIGDSPNTSTWRLGELRGHEFEDIVYGILVSEFADQRPTITIFQTPPVGDGGKDIIVKFTNDIELFGIPIRSKGQQENTIYIECKLTGKPRLRLDHFGNNFLQTREDSFQHFVLVTNS